MSALEITALAVLAFWVLLSMDRRRSWPGELRLPAGAAPDGPEASVVAVVPARDEAEMLPETLPALLAQEGAGFHTVLVDDASSDGTAAVARRLAAEAGAVVRLTVVAAPPRPDAWTGKVWALASGIAAVEGAGGAPLPEWYLLTDADIRHRPGSLAGLLARAAEGFDLVSVMARLHAEGFWERLLIPPFVWFFHLLYPFRAVADPAARTVAAAGGCILVRRRVLAAAGGLAAIRDAVIDDVALARVVRGAGGRLWLGLDDGIVSVRPYAGLSELWRMVGRSAFTQLGQRWAWVALTLLALGLFFVSPPGLAVAGLVSVAGGGRVGPGLRTALWAASAWGLEAWALLPAVRHHRVSRVWSLGMPFAALLYAAMTLGSAWAHGRRGGTPWKGRRYT